MKGSMYLNAELSEIIGAEDENFFQDSETEEVEEVEESEEETEEEPQEEPVKQYATKKRKKRKSKYNLKSIRKSEKRRLSRLRKRLLKLRRAGKSKSAKKVRSRITRTLRRIHKRSMKKSGGKNILHMANPFALKEVSEIKSMTEQKQKSYIKKKSLSTGVLVGTLFTALHSVWRREYSTVHKMEDGSVMTKEQYFNHEEESYDVMKIVKTEQMPWKQTLVGDPQASLATFLVGTALGTFWANTNLKKDLEE